MSVRRLLTYGGVSSGPKPAAVLFLSVEPLCKIHHHFALFGHHGLQEGWQRAARSNGFKPAPATLQQRGYPWDIHQPLPRTTSAVILFLSFWLGRSMMELEFTSLLLPALVGNRMCQLPWLYFVPTLPISLPVPHHHIPPLTLYHRWKA